MIYTDFVEFHVGQIVLLFVIEQYSQIFLYTAYLCLSHFICSLMLTLRTFLSFCRGFGE